MCSGAGRRRLAGLVVALATHVAAPCAQSEWKRVADGPSDRHGHALVYDFARQRVVQFGGNTLTGTRDDTWEWSGGSWTERRPATSPPRRFHHAMAYDHARQRIVLFGGVEFLTDFGDTWEWDGTNWTNIVPSVSPAPRLHATMAYDPIGRRMLLFGGTSVMTGTFFDTWSWDGTTWTNVTPSAAPPAGFGAIMVTDLARGRVVLTNPRGSGVNEWDGQQWIRVSWASPQPARIYPACAYDLHRQRIVMFGGTFDTANGTTATDETWEWDGTGWTKREPQMRPPGRYWPAMAYDAVAGEIVLAAGRIKPTRLNDTWTYAPTFPARYEVFGAGCAGAAGIPKLFSAAGLPWLGDEVEFAATHLPSSGAVALVLGVSRTSWNGVRLPLDLGAIGMPGCNLFTSPDVALPLANIAGSARLRTRICDCPALRGVPWFQQVFAADPAANPLGVVASNGAEARIGAR
jgi:hypothetical protein